MAPTSNQRNFAKEFLHHSQLFWQVTLIFTTAVGGLYLYTQRNQPNNLLLNLFGLVLTGILVWFAASFRVLKQEALAKAIENNELKPNRTHLDQWKPYLFIWWSIGALYLWAIINTLPMTTTTMGIFVTSFIVWSIYVCCFGFSYQQTDHLKRVLESYNAKNNRNYYKRKGNKS